MNKQQKILQTSEPQVDKIIPLEAEVSQENGGQVEAFKWALEKMETATDRFIFNEKFILGLYQSWWKRLFAKHYIGKHLDETLRRFSG